MRHVCKNPPGGGGGRNPYQLIDYKNMHSTRWNISFWYRLTIGRPSNDVRATFWESGDHRPMIGRPVTD